MSAEWRELAEEAGLLREPRLLDSALAYPLLDLDHPRFQDAYALLSCHWAHCSARLDCRLSLIEEQVHVVLPLPLEPGAALSLFAELKIIEELLS